MKANDIETAKTFAIENASASVVIKSYSSVQTGRIVGYRIYYNFGIPEAYILVEKYTGSYKTKISPIKNIWPYEYRVNGRTDYFTVCDTYHDIGGHKLHNITLV